MSDIFVVGTANKVLVLDSLGAFVGSEEESVSVDSEEPDMICELLSDLTFPNDFSGDAVFRRLYLMVEWENGVELAITPWVDGRELVAFKKTFIRSGSGRESVGLPMLARGTWVAVHVKSGVPTGRFAIETAALVGYQPALNTKQLDS